MRSETESSDWTGDISTWSPHIAQALPIAQWQMESEPRMQTVHRKVPAQTPPVPPAPKKQPPQRGARRSWKRGSWASRSIPRKEADDE